MLKIGGMEVVCKIDNKYKVICSCGKDRIATKQSLERSNKCKKCSQNNKFYIGYEENNIQIIDKENGRYVCKCKCGSIMKRSSKEIGRKCKKCYIRPTRKLNIGDFFKGLEIVDYETKNYKYKIKCKCGNLFEKTYQRLKKEKLHCKQCLSLVLSKNKTKNKTDSIVNYEISRTKKSSQKRNIQFNLTEKDFKDMIFTNCYYCGVEPQRLSLIKNKSIDLTKYKINGIDRVDNNQGYIKGNCVPCCEKCNKSKLNYNIEEWKEWLVRISKNINNF